MGFAGRVLRGGLRVGLIAAAVKVSLDNDVWSLRTDESCATYHKFTRDVVPGTIIYKEKLPSKNEVEAEVSRKWNRNVNCAFSYLGQLRSKVAEWTGASSDDAST